MMENEIDNILNSLDNMKRASAPAGFSDRLFQRLGKIEYKRNPWFFQLKYGVAAMIALLMVNSYILFQSNLVMNQEELTIETIAEEWYTESDIIEYEYEIK